MACLKHIQGRALGIIKPFQRSTHQLLQKNHQNEIQCLSIVSC